MARTVIALDLGTKAVKAVVISSRFNSREMVACHTVPVAMAENDEALLTNWRSALEELKNLGLSAQGATIIASYPGGGLSSRILELPFKENKKIDTTLQGELDFQQTITDVGDLAACWTHAAGAKEKLVPPYPVIVSTVKQERLAAILALLKESSFDPQMLLHPAAGYPVCYKEKQKVLEKQEKQEKSKEKPGENGLESAPAIEAETALSTESQNFEELEIVADIGASRTNIAIINSHNELVLTRTLTFGAKAADGELMTALGMSAEEAAHFRETEITLGSLPNTVEGQKALLILESHFRLLASQLRLTMSRLSGEKVAKMRLTLTGGGSRQKGITEFLQKELSIPVSRLAPATLLGPILKGAELLEAEYLPIASLALLFLVGPKSSALDFRRGPFAFQGELPWIKGQIIRGVIGCFAVFLCALLSQGVELHLLNKLDKHLSSQFCKITKQTVKQEICDPRAAISALTTPTGPQGSTLPTYSAVDQFIALSKGVPSELEVVFSNISIRQTTVMIKGTCKDFETLDKLVDSLQKLPCVTEAKQTKSGKIKEEVEFNITMKYECPAGATPLSEAK